MKDKSEQINELLSALTKFQASDPRIENSKKAYNYKYAPLEKVIEVVRPLLEEQGLGFQQYVELSDDSKRVFVTTILFHESGQFIEYEPLGLPVDYNNKSVNAPQAVGISITYARRYALSSVLGINSEDDTDGKAPSRGNSKEQKPIDELRKLYKSSQEAKKKLDKVMKDEGNLAELTAARQMALVEELSA